MRCVGIGEIIVYVSRSMITRLEINSHVESDIDQLVRIMGISPPVESNEIFTCFDNMLC